MRHTGTSDTMPLFMWVSAVIENAHVSEEDMLSLCGRDRIHRWYHAGEPVWMAADSLRSFVTIGRRHERADREVNAMHSFIRVATNSQSEKP